MVYCRPVEQPALLAGFADRHGTLVDEVHGGADLVQEAAAHVHLHAELRPQHLERQLAPQDQMLDAIDRGEGPTILGDGMEAFDFVAVEDCARANLCAMQASTVDRFYNVGTGRRTSLMELAERLCHLTGCNQPIQYAPRSHATLGKNRIGCPKLASEEIGFSAEIELDDGLRRLIEWRKAKVA